MKGVSAFPITMNRCSINQCSYFTLHDTHTNRDILDTVDDNNKIFIINKTTQNPYSVEGPLVWTPFPVSVRVVYPLVSGSGSQG